MIIETLKHDGLELMGWPSGSEIVFSEPEAGAPAGQVVLFETDGIRDIGIMQRQGCGRCVAFYCGPRVYRPERWRVLGVAEHRLVG